MLYYRWKRRALARPWLSHDVPLFSSENCRSRKNDQAHMCPAGNFTISRINREETGKIGNLRDFTGKVGIRREGKFRESTGKVGKRRKSRETSGFQSKDRV